MEEDSFRFEKLDVWRKSVDFAGAIYNLVKAFPRTEQYGLGDQIKRASISISSNIAEGVARDTKKDFARFLNISRGSLFETVSLACLARQVGCITDQDLLDTRKKAIEISKMLSGLRKSVL